MSAPTDDDLIEAMLSALSAGRVGEDVGAYDMHRVLAVVRAHDTQRAEAAISDADARGFARGIEAAAKALEAEARQIGCFETTAYLAYGAHVLRALSPAQTQEDGDG